MQTKNYLAMTALVLSAGLYSGCTVYPGEIDSTVLHAYQQHLESSGPAARLIDDELIPVPGSTGEPLRITEGPDGVKRVHLSLREAIYRALGNNLEIKTVSYSPAVRREEMIQAAAAFDAIVFFDLSRSRTDNRAVSVFGGEQTRTTAFSGGVRKPIAFGSGDEAWASGGILELVWDSSRTRTDSGFTDFNPAYQQSLAVRLTQPLLRNAGPDVTLAELRVARLNYNIAMDEFHANVLRIVNDVQTLYWQLVRARQEYDIQRRLLDRTLETQELVNARRDLDASAVEISQTAAAVASRRATLIQAERNISDIEDRLVRAMADASVTLLDNYTILPTSEPTRDRLLVDNADQIAIALRFNPDLDAARQAIRINDVNVSVAKNQLLPQLDLAASTAVNGVDMHWGESWEVVDDHNYVENAVGLTFEYPLGNRGPKAALRQANYERTRSIISLQDTADQVAIAVNDAVRLIYAAYDEMLAQADAVRINRDYLDALFAREEFRAALTPEFLNVRLQAQEALANSERLELEAIVAYNVAQSNLTLVTGTALETYGIKLADAGDDLVRSLADGVRLPPIEAQPPGNGQAPAAPYTDSIINGQPASAPTGANETVSPY